MHKEKRVLEKRENRVAGYIYPRRWGLNLKRHCKFKEKKNGGFSAKFGGFYRFNIRGSLGVCLHHL